MSALAKLHHMVSAYRLRRAQARTALYIASLPEGVQKDIGWPDRERNFRSTRN